MRKMTTKHASLFSNSLNEYHSELSPSRKHSAAVAEPALHRRILSGCRLIVWLLPVFALLARPLLGQEAAGGSRFVDWALQDPADAFAQVDAMDGLFMLGSAAVLAALSAADAPLSTWSRSRNTGEFALFLDVTNEMGGVWLLPATAVLFGISLATDDVRMQDTAFTSLESVLVASSLVIGMKTVIGRRRPHEGFGPFEFDPFHSFNASFPSGHAANAFASTIPWVHAYRNPLTYSVVGLAATTGVARVVKGHHWPTDVVAGALVGTVVGIVLSRLHANETAHSGQAPNIKIAKTAIR